MTQGAPRLRRLLFTGPASPRTGRRPTSPRASYRPIRALWVDEGPAPGSGRRRDPAAAAAQQFAAPLRRRGLKVAAQVVPGRRPAPARRRPGRGRTRAPGRDRRAHARGQRQPGAEVLARHVGSRPERHGLVRGRHRGRPRGAHRLGRRRLRRQAVRRQRALAARPVVPDTPAPWSALAPSGGRPPRAARGDHRAAGRRLRRLAGLPLRPGAPQAADGCVRAKTGTLTGVSGARRRGRRRTAGGGLRAGRRPGGRALKTLDARRRSIDRRRRRCRAVAAVATTGDGVASGRHRRPCRSDGRLGPRRQVGSRLAGAGPSVSPSRGRRPSSGAARAAPSGRRPLVRGYTGLRGDRAHRAGAGRRPPRLGAGERRRASQ